MKKFIKKMSMCELDPTTGSIVDTFNVEDKVTNAPSVRAVEGRNAVITGEATLIRPEEGNTYQQTQVELNYPTGFNKNNCVVVAFGTRKSDRTEWYYTFDQSVATTSIQVLTGNVPRSVTLTDKIVLNLYSALHNYDLNVDYKVVLMKVA